MARKLKRKASRRATVKRKKAKRAPRKTAALVKQKTARARASMIAKSIPDPTKASFVVQSGSAFLTDGGNFTIDVARAILFPTKEAAQADIDGALVLAETESLFHGAQIVPTKTVLKPHYVFDLVDGEYMLSVVLKAKDDADALSFPKAKALVAKSLKDAVKAVVNKSIAFNKAWG